jgi:HK97 gp10 family phage protein
VPEITLRITNLAQIKAAFLKAPLRMAAELNIAIRQSVFAIDRASKINTPVDTGRLRASHQTIFSNLRGEVGPNTNYALYVHEGTIKMKARPFLLQAVESNEQQVNDYFKKAVQNTLDDIAGSV